MDSPAIIVNSSIYIYIHTYIEKVRGHAWNKTYMYIKVDEVKLPF